MMKLILALLLLTATPCLAFDTSAGPLRIERQMSGLSEPWALDFLPDGGFLVTERGGRLTLIAADGLRHVVKGTPKVWVSGQGGLLDVMVPRDFASSRQVFLSYAIRQPGGAGTALGVGQLSADGQRLDGFTKIFEMAPGNSGGVHFGGRIVESRDGTIFLTMGERGDGALSQDLSVHNGKVIRINRDGSVPGDNPFVGQPGALPEIWSYGHRNPQGAALDASGQLWVSEHGAKGGDEVNRVERGANYGWPVIAYGRNYNGSRIGTGTAAPGMQQPAHYWDPSIAPSGHMIYSGRLWPAWKGSHFVGALKFDYIARLTPGSWAEEPLKARETDRVRDVVEAPDGTIWFLSVHDGAVYRILPDR